MKYIENSELREWVKDNLKKTIFQKAHALAVQTGCQILVKLEDDLDFTQHQYYATDRLRKVFKNNGLRQQPGEKFVSGVTGEPLVDQAIQSDQSDGIGSQTLPLPQTSSSNSIQTSSIHTSTDTADSDMRKSDDANEMGVQGEDRVKPEVGSGSEEVAIPMHLAMTCETSEDTSLDAMHTERPPDEPTGDVDEGGGGRDVVPRVKIKVEPMDDSNQEGEQDGTTSMYQDQELDTTTTTSQSNSELSDSSHFQGTTQASSTSQYLSSLSYQVPASPKPYQCAMCGKAFRSVQVLQKHTHTFHMKTHHVMGVRTGKGRGRGRPPLAPPGPRFTQMGESSAQANRYTCVMCNISFPEVEILQDHMSRTHLGATTTSSTHSEGAPDNPEFPTPGTSQQVASFPTPSGDKPAAQGSPYSQQSGTSSSVPIFPRPVSSPSVSRVSASPGTARRFSSLRSLDTKKCNTRNIMTAILLHAGPLSNFATFVHSGTKPFRRFVTKEIYDEAAMQLQAFQMGIYAIVQVDNKVYKIFVKREPSAAQEILETQHFLCDPMEYTIRYDMPIQKRIGPKLRGRLLELGYVTPEQMLMTK